MRYDPEVPHRIAPITESGKLELNRAMEEAKRRAMQRENEAVSQPTIFM